MELMSTPEIAALFGVSRQRADQLTRLKTFPAPYAVLAIGRIWDKDDVLEWGTDNGRLNPEDV